MSVSGTLYEIHLRQPFFWADVMRLDNGDCVVTSPRIQPGRTTHECDAARSVLVRAVVAFSAM